MFEFLVEPCIHRHCAVTEREDAVHLGGVPDQGFCRRLSRDFEKRISLCLWEDFGGV